MKIFNCNLIYFDLKNGVHFVRKGCKISENILVLQKKEVNLSSDFSFFWCKKGVKLLKISLEKGPFSIFRTTMEYPFFMEVPVPGYSTMTHALLYYQCTQCHSPQVMTWSFTKYTALLTTAYLQSHHVYSIYHKKRLFCYNWVS